MAVVGPVIVTVHLNGNATVSVIRPVDGVRGDHLGEHGNEAFEQSDAEGMAVDVEFLEAEDDRPIQVGAAVT